MRFPLSPQASPSELKNPVINAAFILLFKDLIRLFACYNDGIINLLGEQLWRLFLFWLENDYWIHWFLVKVECISLRRNWSVRLLRRSCVRMTPNYARNNFFSFSERYFKLEKKQCRQALDLYKVFLSRMDKVGDFLKVAEVRSVAILFRC